jgi:hypothetical protein
MNDWEHDWVEDEGLTLRDEFAIALVRGFINETGMWSEDFGKQVYALADKLMEARKQ